MAANSETAAQLFARLGERPPLGNLDPRLIPPGVHPQPGDVVEVYGNSGSGKTEVLMNLAANCILPAEWNGIPLGGLGLSTVFIDTDHQFSMLRLFAMLEKRVMEAVRQKQSLGRNQNRTGEGGDANRVETNKIQETKHCNKHKDSSEQFKSQKATGGFTGDESSGGAEIPQPSEDEVETFVKSCLKRLFVIRVANSDQLVVTLHSLESLFASQSDISVLLIDSVSAFYWLDKMKGEGAQQQGANQKLAFAVLSRLLRDYHLVAFVTKAALISKHTQESSDEDCSNPSSAIHRAMNTEHWEFMSKDWTKLVTHRIILERQDSMNANTQSNSFKSFLKHKVSGSGYLCQFLIDQLGIVHVQ